jgi:hypothetical protein
MECLSFLLMCLQKHPDANADQNDKLNQQALCKLLNPSGYQHRKDLKA